MRRLALVAIGVIPIVAALQSCQRSSDSGKGPSLGNQLALYAKPSVVLIENGAKGEYVIESADGQTASVPVQVGWSGSGFFISSNGYVATNAHVVSFTHDSEEKAKAALRQRLADTLKALKIPASAVSNIVRTSSLRNFQRYHNVIIPDGSRFPFQIKQYGTPVGEGDDQGNDVSILKIEVTNAPVLSLGNSDEVQLQDHVTVIGYPGAARSEELDVKSTLESSITDGKISSKVTARSGAPILSHSAPVTHGNSGGPVLNDANQVIGLATFRGNLVNGQEVQGFNFIVPANTVKEYLPNGVSNVEGPTNQLYREGLELYRAQRYSEAIAKFEEVKRLFPHHSEVDRLIQSSQQAKVEGKERSNLPQAPGAVPIALMLAAITAIGLTLVFLARRRSQLRYASGPVSAEATTRGPATTSANGRQLSLPKSSSPSPGVAHSPSTGPGKSDSSTATGYSVGDAGIMGELAGTVKIAPGSDRHWGFLKCVSGSLVGRQFEIKPDGEYIGRDASASQIVVDDPRISKRHLWIGVKYGRVVVEDRGSRNGAFINDPKSPRVTEAALNPGDTIILGETEVARFEYQK